MDMEPCKFDSLYRAWRNKQRRVQQRFAMVALTAAQCAGNKNLTRSDFMDGWDEEDDE